MRHRIRRFITLSVLLCTATLAGAATPDMPVATINARRILNESRAGKEALAKFQQDFQPREKELQGLAASLREKAAALERAAPTLAPTDLRTRQAEVDELGRTLKRRQQQFAEDREARKRDDIQVVFNLATQAVKQFAEGARIELVFQDVVYANPRTDITNRVIAVMDAQPGK